MLLVRSTLLTVLFFANWIAFAVGSLPLLLGPRRWSVPVFKAWGHSSIWLLRVLVGTKVEIRGRENIPERGALIAAKHQSAFETFALVPVFEDASIVLKAELNRIPFFGWWTRKLEMVSIDRSQGIRSLKVLADNANAVFSVGRQLIIFPEGTRQTPGAPPDYKAGAAMIYERCGVPCVPVALNSGLFWPRLSFVKYPGKLVVEILPAIPPGLDRKTFLKRLEKDIETASDRLLKEGVRSNPDLPLPQVTRARLKQLES